MTRGALGSRSSLRRRRRICTSMLRSKTSSCIRVAIHGNEGQGLGDIVTLAGRGDARSAPRGLPCRWRQATASATRRTCCRSPRGRAAAPAELFGRRRAFRAQGGAQRSAVPEIIAKTYQLTPSELRVLLAVVRVGGVPEVAEALGIGEATVRTICTAFTARPTPAGRPSWSSW